MSHSDFHQRRSIRLPGYDYCSTGAYFVTICAYQKEHLFGEIQRGEAVLSEVGRILMECWSAIPQHFLQVEVDEFVVMPNHIHGIVWINDRSFDHIEATQAVAITHSVGATHASPLPNGPKPRSIGSIVGSFKSVVTKRINEWNPLFGSVWQRNYYECVIRDDQELYAVRQYILNNPLKWEEDSENAVIGAMHL